MTSRYLNRNKTSNLHPSLYSIHDKINEKKQLQKQEEKLKQNSKYPLKNENDNKVQNGDNFNSNNQQQKQFCYEIPIIDKNIKIESSEDKLGRMLRKLEMLNGDLKEKYEINDTKQKQIEALDLQTINQREQKSDLEKKYQQKRQLLSESEERIVQLKKQLVNERQFYEMEINKKYREILEEENVKKEKYPKLDRQIFVTDRLMQKFEKNNQLKYQQVEQIKSGIKESTRQNSRQQSEVKKEKTSMFDSSSEDDKNDNKKKIEWD